MDSAKSSNQGSSLDSLRTVEFRQTLRGYHIDDVDEYLERVAVDAEALQEQLRQAGERLKQAAERIAQLEAMLQEVQSQPATAGVPGAAATVSDDTLQRTLLLAQKFVDQTQADAESQARGIVAEAEDRARKVVGEAELRAKSVTEDTERHLREEISRLESIRTQLAGDVETISRHLDNERSRLRGALSDMLSWVDEHVQPAASLLAQRSSPPSRPTPRPDGDIPTSAAPDTSGGPGGSGGGSPAMSLEGAGRPAVPVHGNSATGGAGSASAADRQGVMPVDEGASPQAIAPH
jgi:DivIVA domain-containing protein